MRHHNKNRTFGRPRRQRTALLRGLAISLIEHGKVKTTEPKAKELRMYVERLITQGRKTDASKRRIVSAKLGEPRPTIIQKLFNDISKRYEGRSGGYTRIIKLGETKAGRREAIIELV